jgi:hypothetical protein
MIQFVPAALLAIGIIGPHNYAYYEFLRWSVSGFALYSVLIALYFRSKNWVMAFCAITLVFNPIVPIYMARQIWKWIDFAVIIIFAFSSDCLNSPNPFQPITSSALARAVKEKENIHGDAD